MKKTKELMNEVEMSESRAASLREIEGEFHYIFWESNFNPITMHRDRHWDSEDKNTTTVEEYLNR